MGRGCAVASCPSVDDFKRPLFRFPDKRPECKLWIRFLEEANKDYMWQIVDNNMWVCSIHFDSKFIVQGLSGVSRIVKGGFPTVHNGKIIDTLRQEHELGISASSNLVEFGPPTLEDQYQQLTSENQLKDAKIQKLNEKVLKLEQKVKDKDRKMRTAEQALKRKLEKENEDWEVKKQKIVADGVNKFLEDNVKSVELKEIVQRTISGKITTTISDVLRCFCYQLRYYSGTRAYNFLRERFNNYIPSIRSFAAWTQDITVQPGFLQESLMYLRDLNANSTKKLHFGLQIDEIHIRKQLIHKGNGMVGFVDYAGIHPIEDTKLNKIASAALFVMANVINAKQKVPIFYILTSGLNADLMKAVITQCLTVMNKCDSRVVSITFDGLPANQVAVKKLGANLDVHSEHFCPSIRHPLNDYPISIFLDVCHMMKLFRNLWKSYGVLRDYKGQIISWVHIHNLQELQKREGLKAAPKLTQRHINFELQKMKTKLCLQIMSRSVAVALSVCRELKIDGLENTHGTEDFLQLMNRLFDILNCRSYGKFEKASITRNRVPILIPFLSMMKFYLLNLEVNQAGKWILLVDSEKKTAVRGLIIAIESLLQIVKNTFEHDEILKFLSMYQFSQDHLELFFSSIRAQFGFNNNPNAVQLAQALKGLICMRTRNVETGNCTALEKSHGERICAFKNIASISHDGDKADFDGDTEADLYDTDEIDAMTGQISPYLRNVIAYIAGRVGGKICNKISCTNCLLNLFPTDLELVELEKELILVEKKDMGGLFIPSKLLLHVCKTAECLTVAAENQGTKSVLKQKLIESTYKACVESKVGVTWRAASDPACRCTHSHELLKTIAEEYLKIRLHHTAREATIRETPSTSRNANTKQYLFKGT